MFKRWKNLKYLILHKYYVFQAGLRYQVPLFQLFVHDWSKFTLTEWFGYTNYWHGEKNHVNHCKFKEAWLSHIHRNKHHWNYWVLVKENGELEALQMPERFVREMIADWVGAGLS